jgi:hypothetical protein
MRSASAGRGRIFCSFLVMLLAFGSLESSLAQSPPSAKSSGAVPASQLERDFFAALRDGDTRKILSYVPKGGVNVGPQLQHATREEINQQFLSHRGLYCKLFDSSCIDAPLDLEHSARACSYRELLTHSKQVRTAASGMTRNNVQQAVLVARIKNDQCPTQNLIDVIFNLDADGWKLFSIP